MRDVPDPDQVVADLTPLVPMVYGAMEVGVARARAYFEVPTRREYDAWLFAHIVRYEAKHHLENLARVRVDFELDDLANSGLALMYLGYPLRVRKAYRGGVPTPGSLLMEQFHAQTFGFIDNSDRPNLFLLWDVFKPSYMLAPDLYVACPRDTTFKYPNVAECHWLVKLPNVALLPQAPVVVDDFDLYEDLDIRRPGESTGTGDAG